MSMSATVEFDKSGFQDLPAELDPDREGLVYGMGLARFVPNDAFDVVTTSVGVEPLSSFFDDSEMLDDEERQYMGLPPAEATWWSLETGLATLKALIPEIEKRPSDSRIGDFTVEEILWELRAVFTILQSASKPDTLFRLVLL